MQKACKASAAPSAPYLPHELHAVDVVKHQQQRRLLHVEEGALQRVQEAVVGLQEGRGRGAAEGEMLNERRGEVQAEGGHGHTRGIVHPARGHILTGGRLATQLRRGMTPVQRHRLAHARERRAP